MGLGNSKDLTIRKIIELSQQSPKESVLQESDIEEIMMNSQFNEKELLKLYQKFQELDEDNAGALTNKQLLNLDEFRFTPFRTRLIDGLQLKSDIQVRATRQMMNVDLKIEDIK
jgi:hypothetical protein